jgi:leucyl aminopeptidase (aminopeptidase T)
MAPANPTVSDLLARNVLTQRLHVRPKETVIIEAWPTSLPWANAFVRQSRRIGAKPVLLYDDEASYWQAVESGDAQGLGQLGDHEWAALEKTDVYVYFWGPENRGRSRALPETTQEELVGFNGRWYELAAKTGLRGARMEIARATETNARYYGVNLRTWQRELVQASLRNPREYDRPIRKLKRALKDGKTLRIRHPNGTDLSLGLAGREPLALDGRVTPETMKRPYGMLVNVPASVVLVALDESTADGTILANGTNYLSNGAVSGGRWKFSEGRLRGARYATGGARFRRPYSAAGEGRDRPGLLEIGLEPAIHVAPELEDCELGALTVGIGGNVGFGGRTKSSFNSWLTVRGAELSIDGRVVVRGGRIC